jgi:hypothetical protein
MTLEIVLIIIIMIISATELAKYISQNYTFGHNYGMCQCTKEAFSENCLFARNIDDNITLRYW